MRIVLLGPPGSGKGELSKRIAEAYKLPIITQSSVVDTAAAENSELGRLAKEARDASRVSDELLLALLRIQLPKMDLGAGYVLVDMPKNSGQADVLDSVLNDLARPVDLVLNLEVDTDELMERLVGHIQCDHCGANYNLYVNPPMVDGVCDACGARVSRRPDDYEETISNRLRVYENQMGPLLQYYSLSDKLQRVDAGCETEELWTRVREVIDATPSPEVETVGEEAAAPPAPPTTKKVIKKSRVKSGAPSAEAPVKKAAKKSPAKVSKASSEKRAGKNVAAKAVGKKAAAKVVKKAAKKKAAPKKAATKKVAAKALKKAPAKQVAAKASKKVTVKKVAKKKVAKKVTAKRLVKQAAKKTSTKKVAKAAAKKSTVRKAPAKTSKTKVAKKPAAKKKAVQKKPATKKAVKKKARR